MPQSSKILEALYRGDAAAAQQAAAQTDAVDLFEAAALGLTERVRALIEQDPGCTRSVAADGFTALHLAAFFGHEAVAAALLAAGGAVDAVSDNAMQVRPLHSAAARAHAGMMRLLLDHGASPDARQAGGYTALHSRALHGDLSMVKELLARGADPDLRADDGRSAADMAREKGHLEIARYLEEARGAR